MIPATRIERQLALQEQLKKTMSITNALLRCHSEQQNMMPYTIEKKVSSDKFD